MYSNKYYEKTDRAADIIVSLLIKSFSPTQRAFLADKNGFDTSFDYFKNEIVTKIYDNDISEAELNAVISAELPVGDKITDIFAECKQYTTDYLQSVCP